MNLHSQVVFWFLSRHESKAIPFNKDINHWLKKGSAASMLHPRNRKHYPPAEPKSWDPYNFNEMCRKSMSKRGEENEQIRDVPRTFVLIMATIIIWPLTLCWLTVSSVTAPFSVALVFLRQPFRDRRHWRFTKPPLTSRAQAEPLLLQRSFQTFRTQGVLVEAEGGRHRKAMGSTSDIWMLIKLASTVQIGWSCWLVLSWATMLWHSCMRIEALKKNAHFKYWKKICSCPAWSHSTMNIHQLYHISTSGSIAL